MASFSKSSVNMSTVMKDISDALSLDRNEQKEEAYRKYLECVLRISTKLLKDLYSEGGHVTFNKDVTRFVKLGQQCMDRVASIATEQAGKGPGPPQVPNTTKIATPGLWMSVHALPSGGIVTPPTNTSTVKKLDLQSSGSKKLSPMEVAVKHNQQLLAAYKARQRKNKSLSTSQTLALTVQRKMAENLAIAKAREEALAKKMRERQKRLEEQAARRFHTPIGLSEEEQHQRQIYTKILEFEQEEIWMLDMRKQLEASPGDVIVIFNLIEKVFSCESHPLTQQLKICQDKTLQRIYPLVQNKTEQINCVKVPLPKELLAVLTKFQKDQVNKTTKTITRSKLSANETEDHKKDISDEETENNLTEEDLEEASESNNDLNVKSVKDESNQEKDDQTVGQSQIENDNSHNKEVVVKEIKHLDKRNETETDIVLANEGITSKNMDDNADKVLKDNLDQIQVKDIISGKESYKNNDIDGASQNSNEPSVEKDKKSGVIQNSDTDNCNKDESGDKIIAASNEIVENSKSGKDDTDVSIDSSSEQDIGSVTESIKQDLEIATVKGQQLQNKLEAENKNLKSAVRALSLEYEKYNVENMDDLFDDDMEEDDDGDSAFGSSFYSTISGTWSSSGKSEDLPEKSKKATNTYQPKTESCDTESDAGIKLESDESDTTVQDTGDNDSELKPCDISSKDENANQRDSLTKNVSFQNLDGVIKQLRNEAYHRHLKHITEDILTSIEKIQVLFVIGFEQLDTAEGRDQCNVLVEKYFFRPIWKYLLMLFRLANEPKEIALAHMMTMKQNKEPEVFSVRQKLCLSPSTVSDNGDYPYKSAVEELCRLVEKPTMLEKLDCLVKTSRQVLLCVDLYYEQEDKDVTEKPSIGADDLLPVLCYIVARCKMPEIVSECHAMERFIHEGYMYGEEGYCLTSFQTAINYLISEGMKAEASDTD